MFLTKEELLQELRLETDIVELESGDVMVSELSAPDYLSMGKLCAINDFEVEGTIKVDVEKWDAAVIAFCVVDPDTKKRLYSNDDIEMLMKTSNKKTSKILEAAKRLNGMLGDEGKDLTPTESDLNSGE
jgi:hypothetical protein